MEKQNFDSIKLRLLEFAEKQKIPKGKFYDKISISQSNFGGKSLESSLSSQKIAEILIIFPELNPDWLLNGIGEMIRDNFNSSNSKPLSAVPPADPPVATETPPPQPSGDNIKAVIDLLQASITEKDRQITEKDRQISRLLSIIEAVTTPPKPPENP